MATLNAERYLDDCLESVRAQDYPQELIEIVIGDGGSTDATVAIAQRHGVDLIVHNERKTGESGKAVALRHARRELILSLDADNYLVGRDWLRRMVTPLVEDPGIFAAEPVRWYRRDGDPALNRYFMMVGVTEPVSLFLGNHGHISEITGRWTGYPHTSEPRDGYLAIELDPERVPTMGANGFLVRADVLREIEVGDYYFDIDVFAELVRRGHHRIAKVDLAIGHQFAADLRAFTRKQRRRIQDFLFFRNEREYPWLERRGSGVTRFVVATVTVIPLLVQTWRGYRRVPDVAWLYHIPVCWLTLVLYGWNVMTVPFRRAPHSRVGWGS